MTCVISHDFPSLENGLTKYHDFRWMGETLHILTNLMKCRNSCTHHHIGKPEPTSSQNDLCFAVLVAHYKITLASLAVLLFYVVHTVTMWNWIYYCDLCHCYYVFRYSEQRLCHQIPLIFCWLHNIHTKSVQHPINNAYPAEMFYDQLVDATQMMPATTSPTKITVCNWENTA